MLTLYGAKGSGSAAIEANPDARCERIFERHWSKK